MRALSSFGPIVQIALLIVGALQWFALFVGVEQWLEWGWLLSAIIALLLDGIPLIGNILTYVGATEVWGWPWYWAALLAFGWFGLSIVFTVLAAMLDSRRLRQVD